jgi:hypothetical protein
MTEETPDQSFGRYLAAKKAVAAHGFSENFEEEQSFATAPSSSASWSGQMKVSSGFVKTFEIPTTIVASGTFETLFTFSQGGSMATQQPRITEDESVEEIIWHVGTTLSVRYKAKLASRLSELQKAVQEEELDSRGITVRSLQHFIELLKAYPSLRCPTVSVTPDRNIYATWKSGSDRVFSIHFLPDGKVRFVIFCPNDKHSGETIRLSGAATVDVIIDIAKPHGVLKWASE